MLPIFQSLHIAVTEEPLQQPFFISSISFCFSILIYKQNIHILKADKLKWVTMFFACSFFNYI